MAPTYPNHGRIDGPIVIIGFGSIGQGTLPLIERHFTYDPHRVHVIEPSDEHRTFLEQRGRALRPPPGDARELPGAADAALPRGARLLRQPVGRHQLARAHAALPRARGALRRHRGRALGRALLRPVARRRPTAPTTRCARRCGPRSGRNPGGPTAVSCCGANPGMVSWLLKEALLRLAADLGRPTGRRADRAGWARLMQRRSGSRACTSPSATPRPGATPSRSAASSTPGRSRASSPRASSRPSSAGAATRAGSRRTATGRRRAAGRRSISTRPGC